jgi:hypothetical protein
MSHISRFTAITTLALICSSDLVNMPVASAWDSDSKFNPNPTHSYLTNWGIDQLKAQYPELQQYRSQVVEGANTELHEL